MAHEIEQFADGSSGMAAAGRAPWHRLGYLAPGPMTAEELLRESKLADWNVRKVPVSGITDPVTGGVIDSDGDFLTVRTNPVTGKADRLGMVGANYTIIQNEELTEFLQLLTDESGAVFDTAGSLNRGARVFVTMRMPEPLKVGGFDDLDLNLAVFNRHDGWGSLVTVATPVRVVCANTERAALRNHASVYRVRHSGSTQRSIAQARDALRLTFKHADAFAAEAEKLLATEMKAKEFGEFLDKLLPFPADKGKVSQRSHQAMTDRLKAVFAADPTLEGIHGTRWGAYNAITRYLDHEARVTGRREAALVRAERALTGDHAPSTQLKERAFSLLALAA